MTLPQSNARLLSVAGGGGGKSSDWREDRVPGPAKFTGNVGAYYVEQRKVRPAPTTGVDILIERRLVVESRSPAIDWRNGDVVTFSTRKGTQTGTVQDIGTSELGEVAGSGVETTTLHLEPA